MTWRLNIKLTFPRIHCRTLKRWMSRSNVKGGFLKDPTWVGSWLCGRETTEEDLIKSPREGYDNLTFELWMMKVDLFIKITDVYPVGGGLDFWMVQRTISKRCLHLLKIENQDLGPEEKRRVRLSPTHFWVIWRHGGGILCDQSHKAGYRRAALSLHLPVWQRAAPQEARMSQPRVSGLKRARNDIIVIPACKFR